MEYTISALAKLSGVSSRTLRYYDQIKLLQPQRTNSAGYRIYGRQEVDRLQQILYFKSFGLSLETIRGILDEPQESIQTVLLQHYQQLLQERAALDSLLTTLAQTIDYYEG
ncbi:MerR family transcriptional regulator, partial [Enterococcus casseliflavus]